MLIGIRSFTLCFAQLWLLLLGLFFHQEVMQDRLSLERMLFWQARTTALGDHLSVWFAGLSQPGISEPQKESARAATAAADRIFWIFQ